jgi:hypothetical protein
MGACTLDKDWPVYIGVSLVTFFAGLIVLLPLHVAWHFSRGDRRQSILARHGRTRDRLSKIRTVAESVLSGNTIVSKAAVSSYTHDRAFETYGGLQPLRKSPAVVYCFPRRLSLSLALARRRIVLR